jgi:spectinomycin phosphotransferase
MIENLTLSDQHIIDCLNTHYGITVITLTFLPLGADENAATYKVQTKDFSYFVKLKHGHHELGAIIQTLLHNSGIQQIISPVKTQDNRPTHYINNLTLIVYPFIEGTNGFNCTLTNDQWITLGKALKQVHSFNMPLLIKDQIQRESYSPKWRKAVQVIYTHIDIEPSIADDTALKLLTFMKEQRGTIQRLVDHADQLGKQIQKQSPEFVLCHSDIHGGNILITNDGTLYIVDWDQPIMAPKERDLMFIGGGVGNIWNNSYEEKFFYKGYGKTKISKKILAYYRHERIVEDIALYAQKLLLTSSGGKDRPTMYKHFTDMFEPNGVVDIAFASNKN